MERSPRTPEVSVVAPATFERVWEHFLPQIQRGLSFGSGDEHTAETMKAAVLDGSLKFWVAHDEGELVAGMIFELVQCPARRKVLINMLVGRDMEVWFDERFHLLTEFKALNGAATIEASCRPGLARFLEEHGWRRKAVVMEAC